MFVCHRKTCVDADRQLEGLTVDRQLRKTERQDRQTENRQTDGQTDRWTKI